MSFWAKTFQVAELANFVSQKSLRACSLLPPGSLRCIFSQCRAVTGLWMSLSHRSWDSTSALQNKGGTMLYPETWQARTVTPLRGSNQQQNQLPPLYAISIHLLQIIHCPLHHSVSDQLTQEPPKPGRSLTPVGVNILWHCLVKQDLVLSAGSSSLPDAPLLSCPLNTTKTTRLCKLVPGQVIGSQHLTVLLK